MLKLIKAKKSIIVMILVAVLSFAGYNASNQDVSKVVDIALTAIPDDAPNKASAISNARRTHILYGDNTGGGHLYGTGTPCKSEFPKHWNEDTIIKEIDLIASNDNINWEQQHNGYYVTEQNVGTVKVRVVKGRKNRSVITAYPTNTGRNPCPANNN